MPRTRRARVTDPSVDLDSEIDADGSVDFEDGLPPTAAATTGRRGVRKHRDDEHPLGPAGARYRSDLDFESGLERVDLSKDATVSARTDTPTDDAVVDFLTTPVVEIAKAARDSLTLEEFRAAAIDVPAVLTWEAVRKRELPALGQSGLPASLEQDVPPQMRFWKATTVADALAVREALVESGLFTTATIRKVAGELRRVVPELVVKMYAAPTYEDAAVVVPKSVRAVEKVAGLLASSERKTLIFDEDVTEAVGLAAVLAKTAALDADWIVAARDTAEARKALGSRAVFKLISRDDLVFATNAEIEHEDSVAWIESREQSIVRFALGDGREIELLKADAGEERVVFGIVLEPDTVDAQGDTISADEIEKAAHRFMSDFRNLGVQHEEIVDGDALQLLESYVAPVAMTIAKKKIKAGTWLMKERVVSDDLWAGVKSGAITGFSIGGSGIRKPT